VIVCLCVSGSINLWLIKQLTNCRLLNTVHKVKRKMVGKVDRTIIHTKSSHNCIHQLTSELEEYSCNIVRIHHGHDDVLCDKLDAVVSCVTYLFIYTVRPCMAQSTDRLAGKPGKIGKSD